MKSLNLITKLSFNFIHIILKHINPFTFILAKLIF